MEKGYKWWEVPVILSAVLGGMPALFAVTIAVYGFLHQDVRSWHEAVGGFALVSLVVLATIWIPIFIVLRIRKLKERMRAKRIHAQLERARNLADIKKFPEMMHQFFVDIIFTEDKAKREQMTKQLVELIEKLAWKAHGLKDT